MFITNVYYKIYFLPLNIFIVVIFMLVVDLYYMTEVVSVYLVGTIYLLKNR